jgi:signal transduction histidine kinase
VPEIVELDPDRFQQVLLNLITNAIKFTQENKVTIYCSGIPDLRPTSLKIDVEDNGVGIPMDKVSCLFKEFSKISNN